jgi:glycosyltransferase involved in cell wall biosynthesis
VKKRVLQFIGSFHQGGSERQAVSLAGMLIAEGTFDVRIATLNNEGILKPTVAAIGAAEPVEFRLTSFYNARFFRQLRQCAEYLRRSEIDLVHTHDFYTNVFGMAAATLARVPVKITSKRETGELRSRAQRYVEKLAFGRADAIVANSFAVRDHLTVNGIPTEKISVIHNGIDLVPIAAASMNDHLGEALLASNGNSRFVTLVANLRHPVKNVPMLLRAARHVTERDENVHFIIAGEGEMRDELQGLAVRLGVARNTHFIGRCDNVASLLAASDICVLTSKAEGFSNSLVEYMAAGKPVVATKVGGASEAIIDGETGYLVESDDDSALSTRLTELLADRAKARTVGAAARRAVTSKFSKTEQLSKVTDLYKGLIA